MRRLSVKDAALAAADKFKPLGDGFVNDFLWLGRHAFALSENFGFNIKLRTPKEFVDLIPQDAEVLAMFHICFATFRRYNVTHARPRSIPANHSARYHS